MEASNQVYKSDNEVLFQKLGTRWYVFSEIENDFVYSPLPDGIDPRSTNLNCLISLKIIFTGFLNIRRKRHKWESQAIKSMSLKEALMIKKAETDRLTLQIEKP